MTATWIRLRALVIKELQAILGDKQSLRLLILPVLVQLLLFPFAATLEVKNNTLGVLDQDSGPEVAEILERVTQTPAFHTVLLLRSEAEADRFLDSQRVLLFLRFPPRFSESVLQGEPKAVQVIIDGRRSNSAQIAVSYLQRILAGVPLTVRKKDADPLTVRHWYNQNLDYYRFIVPCLAALITTISALIVTALSVAREREQGTLEQLLVSPLTPGMIFLGKAAPALLVAVIQASIILLGGVFGYGIPFQGSLALFYGCMVPYVAALVGVGLFISSLCSTQQQAFLGVFLFMMPCVVLSGFVAPIDNMPHALQLVTWANPVRHFIEITKGVYLKAAVFSDVAVNVKALLIIAAGTATLGLFMFRRRLS